MPGLKKRWLRCDLAVPQLSHQRVQERWRQAPLSCVAGGNKYRFVHRKLSLCYDILLICFITTVVIKHQTRFSYETARLGTALSNLIPSDVL